MTLQEWIRYDQFWQEAIFKATEQYVKKKSEASKGEMDNFMKSLSEQKLQSGGAAPIHRPNFNMP
jgi:hypothetical protein